MLGLVVNLNIGSLGGGGEYVPPKWQTARLNDIPLENLIFPTYNLSGSLPEMLKFPVFRC
jgi:hypothetical protein